MKRRHPRPRVPAHYCTGRSEVRDVKYTPGPWRVGDAGATVFGPPNGSPSPATIARVSFAMIPSEEMVANARLIAAAPDLLDALQDLTSGNCVEALQSGGLCFRDNDHSRACLVQALSVIAKAEGRS